jgi:hypothetical protein
MKNFWGNCRHLPFNFMDRMADAFGAPVEGFQDMIAQTEESAWNLQ